MAKSNKNEIVYEDVDAAPVKSFFVSMLTRDIRLEDAILDLLDNCVDGIIRSKTKKGNADKPYQGFKADITFNKDTFTISDNCGGIPVALHPYAFHMGAPKDKPKDTKGTVGVYGIGMKRAIFKMGEHCLISSQNGENRYEVEITPEWLNTEAGENAWKIPVKATDKQMEQDGTTIVVGHLYQGIKSRFGDQAQAFQTDLMTMIATHYAFIIDKGFEVSVNGNKVEPKPTKLIFSEANKGIKPFIFKTSIGGVEVFLTIGFTRPIPSIQEITEEQEAEERYSSLNAGWTVICNDRAVLYCDRTTLTGWGEAGVPRYHTQFIAISGIVEFKSDDPLKLPTTTTKRGIDASDDLYLQVKNKMREGMMLFIKYTNQWKGEHLAESKKHIAEGKPLRFEEIKNQSAQLKFSTLAKSYPAGSQYKPNLPEPKKLPPNTRRISFSKDRSDVEKVAMYLFEKEDEAPSKVGERCFDIILKEAV